MDLASIIGFIAGIAVTIFGIGLSKMGRFIDRDSIIITFGGAFVATLIAYPMKDVINSLKAFTQVFRESNLNEGSVIKKIIDLSNTARKEGLLALEEAANDVNDDFLKKGILLIVDGTDPELVRNILETELSFVENRHKDVQGFWENIGAYGPAWGMIGTLVGLVNMLSELDDPSTIGSAMAVALITTFYGSLLANLIAIPSANKLKVKSAKELLLKEVMIEGILSIQAGENPRVIEEKLKAFLSPTLRNRLVEDAGGDKEGE